jgi:hypothetical protein
MLVIGKHFDHAASFHTAARALPDHPFQLTAQGSQYRDALLDLFQVMARDSIGITAGTFGVGRQRQQVANLVDLEAEIPRMTDKPQRIDSASPIAPLVPLGAVGGG